MYMYVRCNYDTDQAELLQNSLGVPPFSRIHLEATYMYMQSS